MSSKLKSSQIKTTTFSNILTGADNVQTALTTLDTHVQPVALGGTNITSYTAGDIIYADGATSLAKLPKGGNGQVLAIQSGSLVWQDQSFSTLFDGYYNKQQTGLILDGYYNSTEVTNLLSGYLDKSDWIIFGDTFTKLDDGYFSILDSAQNREIFKQGRLIKFRDSTNLISPTDAAYCIIDSATVVGLELEIYISGNPIEDNYDVLEYTMVIDPKEMVFYFDGYYADNPTNDLLYDNKKKYWNTTYENNHIVKFEAYQFADDTGANQPIVNVQSCCTLNSGDGLSLSTSIVSTGANLDFYSSQFKTNLAISVVNSSNGDADTLSLKIIYVPGPEKINVP